MDTNKALQTIDTATGKAAPAEISTERVYDIFSQIARKYERFNAVSSFGAYRRWLDGMMRQAPIKPSDDVLDIAGGTGDVSRWVARFHKPRHIQCTDLVPEMLDLFLTPLLSVSLAAYITILFIGPIFVWLENSILGLLMFLLSVPLGLGYILIGLIYSPSVVTGLHQMYTTIDVSMLAQYGVTYWLPIASAANIAQGGACLAVALKTKSDKTKSLAVPAGISCLLGITEPAIFGVNLPNLKPFACGMAGSACGALMCYISSSP